MYAGRKSETWVMLCPACSKRYVHDRRNVSEGWHNESQRRGWVLTSIFKKEQAYHAKLKRFQAAVVRQVNMQCRAAWRRLLLECKTKKALYQIVERHQAYSTFLSHHRGKTLEEMSRELGNASFHYDDTRHVLKACGLNPDADSLASHVKPTPPDSLPARILECWLQGFDVGNG